MTASFRSTWLPLLALVCATIVCPKVLTAEDSTAKDAKGQAAGPVDMFQGMKDGRLEVKLIQITDHQANILLTNKTNAPLSVQMPEAWAGVPVLAQKGKGGGKGGGAAQRTGGGGGGGGGRGGGGGGGPFNIPPEKTTKLEVATVCLDHGQPNPTAHMAYEIKPIEEVISDPQLQELIKLFGQGQLDLAAAQAATWHLSNHMTWDELASKEIKHLSGVREAYFSRAQIEAAMAIAAEAQRQVAKRPAADPNATPNLSSSKSG